MNPRRANADDAARLALIGAASFLETFANDHPVDDMLAFINRAHSVSAWTAVLATPDSAVWIVEEAAGAPVGYAVLTSATLPGTGDGDAELKRLYLLSKWQGTGVGRTMFDAAAAEAKRRGAVRLVLSVYTRNPRAIAFYERRGFVTIGKAAFPGFADAFSDFVMAKPL